MWIASCWNSDLIDCEASSKNSFQGSENQKKCRSASHMFSVGRGEEACRERKLSQLTIHFMDNVFGLFDRLLLIWFGVFKHDSVHRGWFFFSTRPHRISTVCDWLVKWINLRRKKSYFPSSCDSSPHPKSVSSVWFWAMVLISCGKTPSNEFCFFSSGLAWWSAPYVGFKPLEVFLVVVSMALSRVLEVPDSRSNVSLEGRRRSCSTVGGIWLMESGLG